MPKKRLFNFSFLIVLVIGLLLRILAIKNNNFYFTMDQGRDAIAVRQILKGKLTLDGPRASIEGVYNGPLWYYLISLGYLFTFGHPIGGVLILIFINLLAIYLMMIVLRKQINLFTSLIAGFGLVVLRPFFETSWYAFNPHLLPFICLSLTISLSLLNKEKEHFFIFAGALIGLVFHSEMAFIPPVFLLFLGLGLYQFLKKKLNLTTFFSGLAIFACFLLPHLFSEGINNFSQTRAVINELTSSTGVVSGVNLGYRFKEVLLEILKLTSQSTIVYPAPLGALVFLLTSFIFIIIGFKKKRFDFRFKFISLTLIIWLVSIFWFSTNKGMSSWHLVGLPPIIFISFLLSFTFLKNKIGLIFQLLIILLHAVLFISNLKHYFKPSDDQSILQNELKAIDWIYQQSLGKDFRTYTFLPSVYDYPYQYLFPWYGKKKFGYLPCEYSTYPGISAGTYVKDSDEYQRRKIECSEDLFFLIIEPPVEQLVLDQWYQGIIEKSELLGKTKIGKISLEKRRKIS